MKIFVVLHVSILLASALFCPMVMAAPHIPDDFRIVAPNPSLPKEVSAFWGKYEGVNGPMKYYVIVAKIDEEKATLHIYREGSPIPEANGWETVEAELFKESGKYQLWYRTRLPPSYKEGPATVTTLKGKYLELRSPDGLVRLSRVSESAVTLPSDLKMVQPDASLPKELSAFLGKWEGRDYFGKCIYIVEKIDNEKASLYVYEKVRSGQDNVNEGWYRHEGIVSKKGENYEIWFPDKRGHTNLTLKGQYLDVHVPLTSFAPGQPYWLRLTRFQ